MRPHESQNHYNAHISAIKGIAMLGILWEHATLSFDIPVVNRIPSMLMLPLFVIVSGYCFKDYYLTHRLKFVGKRIKSLYWPFVKWAAIYVLLHNVFCYIYFYPPGTVLYTWHDIVDKIPHILVMHSPEPLIGANWFLTELFFGTMVFIALAPCIKRWPWAGAVGFAAIAVALNLTGFHFRLRDVSFMCASYYTLGYMARGAKLSYGWRVTMLMAAIFILGSLTVPGNFQKMNAPWIVANYATVIAGSWAVASIAWHIVKQGGWLSRCLTYIGNHTLIILILHFTAMHMVSWVLVRVMNLPHEHIGEQLVVKELIWAWPIYFVAAVALPLAFDWANSRLMKYLKNAWR